MNQSSDESHIREAFQRLKRTDERHVPGFDDVLERSVRLPRRRSARRLQIAVACSTLAVLFVVFLFVRPLFDDPNGQRRPNIVEGDWPRQPADSTRGDSTVEISFEHFQTAVDDFFVNSEVEAVETPEWSIRTDSLLALNLELPLTEE